MFETLRRPQQKDNNKPRSRSSNILIAFKSTSKFPRPTIFSSPICNDQASGNIKIKVNRFLIEDNNSETNQSKWNQFLGKFLKRDYKIQKILFEIKPTLNIRPSEYPKQEVMNVSVVEYPRDGGDVDIYLNQDGVSKYSEYLAAKQFEPGNGRVYWTFQGQQHNRVHYYFLHLIHFLIFFALLSLDCDFFSYIKGESGKFLTYSTQKVINTHALLQRKPESIEAKNSCRLM